MELETVGTGEVDTSQNIIQISEVYKREAQEARRNREVLNRRNWDVYHMRQDYSHKKPGQSREFLPKQKMAVEQSVQFFQQAFVDVTDWWRAEYAPGRDEQNVLITKDECKKIVDRYLEKMDWLPFVGDMTKTGLLASVMIVKVYGEYTKKPFFVFEEEVVGEKIKQKIKRGFKKPWEPRLKLVQPENYYVDPSGKGLYEMEELFLDYFEVKALSEGDDPLYDKVAVEAIGKDYAEDWNYKLEHARETNQNIPLVSRQKVKINEYWGTIVDQQTGEILHENVTWTIANDNFLISGPTPNPFWHGESPFVACPIIRVPGSVWHTAMMDAPSANNITQNELWNLMVDGAMMSVFGIKQYRPDYAENDSDFSDGIPPGTTITVSSVAPPGSKVLERVDTSSVPQDALAMFQNIQAEFNVAAMTNDLRMGNLPGRAVKATEVVEANQTITSVFGGISKVIEDQCIEPILRKLWLTLLQHISKLDKNEMRDLLGEMRAAAVMNLSSEEIFSNMFGGNVFKVFGMSKTLAKMKDYRKVTAFLQTISSSPLLVQEFSAKYSMGRLMEEILRSLDVNTERLKMDPQEKMAAEQRMMQAMQMQQMMNAGGNVGGKNTAPGNSPQAGSENTGSMGGSPQGRPQPNGPRS